MKLNLHRPDTGLPYAVLGPAARGPWLPVVLFLHGSRERGSDGVAPTRVGLAPAMRAARHDWPVVAVFPQCPDGETWTGETLELAIESLKHAIRTHGLSRQPAALTGISIGGKGVWEAATRWPLRWSRIMPIGAPAHPTGLRRIERMPIWVHHGGDDDIVPVDESLQMVRRLAARARHFRYDEHAGAGHDVWERVYGSVEVARWLSGSYDRGLDQPRIRPVFIGGTGRSGTTPMSSIIVRHPDFVRTPEIRIHGREGGLVDVLEGRSDPAEFAVRVQRHWFYRWWPGQAPVGIHRLVDESTWNEVLRRYQEDFASDPEGATARVMRAILDPAATDAGATAWVEHSPLNGRNAATLHRLLPDMQLIHTIRDGRDVAVSMTRQEWGPDNAEDAVREWAIRLREAWLSTRALPEAALLEVRWEELVETDRERQLKRVVDFLGIRETPGMRAFFDTHVSAGKAHLGRWRIDLSAGEADRVDKLYRELLAQLADEGVGALPVPPA